MAAKQQRNWTRFTILYTVVRYGAALVMAFFVAAFIWPIPSDSLCVAGRVLRPF